MRERRRFGLILLMREIRPMLSEALSRSGLALALVTKSLVN
jgi:hypothetical protein